MVRGLEEVHRRRAEDRRSARRGTQVSRPNGRAERDAGDVRERRHAARSDHGDLVSVPGIAALMTDTASDSVDLLIVGAGPCGLAAAITAMHAGLSVSVVESTVVVASIAQYPTYATFFSTAEKLSLGDVPFIVAGEKPTRRDALAYY